MDKSLVHEKVGLMIKNLNQAGEEEMLHGKYAKAFSNLKQEADRALGEYIVNSIGEDLIKSSNVGSVALYKVATVLNYYLGKAIVKERSLELVDMLIDSAKGEFERMLAKEE